MLETNWNLVYLKSPGDYILAEALVYKFSTNTNATLFCDENALISLVLFALADRASNTTETTW